MMKATHKKKLIHGIGINDSEHPVTRTALVDGKSKIIWICPFYNVWRSMLARCYSPVLHKRSPTYIGCSVVEEWHKFSVFREWMKSKDWKNKELDKDILYKGNKIYSPDNCVFLTSRINTFISDCGASRGQWPIGVYWNRQHNKFMAQIQWYSGKQKNLGYFDCPNQAHKAWLMAKLELAKWLASDIYTCGGDERVGLALIKRYSIIEE